MALMLCICVAVESYVVGAAKVLRLLVVGKFVVVLFPVFLKMVVVIYEFVARLVVVVFEIRQMHFVVVLRPLMYVVTSVVMRSVRCQTVNSS